MSTKALTAGRLLAHAVSDALSSTRPDGRPHVVSLWFLWDGASILAFSKPHAQKVRNLQFDPRVMLAVGEPGLDFDVELIDAIAELVPAPTHRLLPDSFAAKYGDRLAHHGITCDRYAAIYSQPIGMRPIRWLDWGGRGWSIDRDIRYASQNSELETQASTIATAAS